MKKLLLYAAAGLAGWFIWKRYFAKRSALTDHLAEEQAYQEIGRIATRANIEAIPATTSQELVPIQTAIGQVWLPPSLAGGGPADNLNGYRRDQWGVIVN